MWGLIFGIVSLAGATQIEKPLTVQINGQAVQVRAATYLVNFDAVDGAHVKSYTVTDDSPLTLEDGKVSVNEVELLKPTEFNLINGNKIILEGSLGLDAEAKISLAAILESKLVEWKMADGRTLLLNCGGRFNPDMSKKPRYVRFYNNQQIATGCDNVAPNTVQAVNGDTVELNSMSGALDFREDGLLEYVEKGYVAELNVLGQKVKLAPKAEIHFHKNGLPHFFTLAAGASLKIQTPSAELKLSNPPGTLASITLSETQTVERGYLAEAVKVGQLTVGPGRVAIDPATGTIGQVEIAPQVVEVGDFMFSIAREVQLYASGKLAAIFVGTPHQIVVGGVSYLAAGQIGFDEAQNIRMARLAADSSFVFEGKKVPLYVGDVLIFSETGKIVSLKPGPGGPKDQSSKAQEFGI